MLITSRSYDEYLAMFGLVPADLAGGVVDVSAGGSSFVAGVGVLGLPVVAVDPAYAKPRAALDAAVRAAVSDGHAIIADNPDRFVWDYYGDLDRHAQLRAASAQIFLADRANHPNRYVAGALPRLPLVDRAAGLVLCSHLLFTWSDKFGYGWHRAALRELTRVAGRGVRIFPLVTAGTGAPVPYLADLMAVIEDDGWDVRRQRVPYEFQRGGNEMLVLTAPSVNTQDGSGRSMR